MFINIYNFMMACYPISVCRGAIQLRMIGWELIQNNRSNIICIFLRKLTYFNSTSTINSLTN